MDFVPIIVSAVLLLILLPATGYLFITTDHRDRLADHVESDDRNFREIRQSLEGIRHELNSKFDTMITMMREEGR